MELKSTIKIQTMFFNDITVYEKKTEQKILKHLSKNTVCYEKKRHHA